MKRLTVAALVAALAVQATAQQLTRAQAGREAVGNCYSNCMRAAIENEANLTRQSNHLVDTRYNIGLPPESAQRFEELLWCVAANSHGTLIDTCNAGCMDLETVYGVRASNARQRFKTYLSAELAALREYGLWGSSYRDTVDVESACLRIFERTATAAVVRGGDPVVSGSDQ